MITKFVWIPIRLHFEHSVVRIVSYCVREYSRKRNNKDKIQIF